jgi:hypothetical protein
VIFLFLVGFSIFPEEYIEPIGHVARFRHMHVETSSSAWQSFSFYFVCLELLSRFCGIC